MTSSQNPAAHSIRECLSILYICKLPVPVLKKAFEKLLNILENEALIFFFIQLPWGCSRLVKTFAVHILKTSLCSLNTVIAIFELLLLYLGASDLNVTELVPSPPPIFSFISTFSKICDLVKLLMIWKNRYTNLLSLNLPCSSGARYFYPSTRHICWWKFLPIESIPCICFAKEVFFSLGNIISFRNP